MPSILSSGWAGGASMFRKLQSTLQAGRFSVRASQHQSWKLSRSADRRRFVTAQVEYFTYLHHMLSALKGSRTLRDVFLIDVVRYGPKHWRGRLAARWSQRYEHSGGDLYATWFDCCDTETLALLKSAQSQGEQALITTFKQVADVLLTKRQIKRALLEMAGPGVLAISIFIAMLAVVPLYSVPQLFSAFGDLPDMYLGTYSIALRQFAEQLSALGLLALSLSLLLVILLRLSLSRLHGRVRHYLDLCQPWSSYRLYHSYRVFALLSVLLQVQSASQGLSVSLDAVETGGNGWLRWRLNQVRQRLREGATPYVAFNDGFLRLSEAWYFSDITSAQGLEQGLAATASHLHQQLLSIFRRYAQVLKWSLLIGSVLGLMSLGLWHFLAIEELRSGLLLFHSS